MAEGWVGGETVVALETGFGKSIVCAQWEGLRSEVLLSQVSGEHIVDKKQ